MKMLRCGISSHRAHHDTISNVCSFRYYGKRNVDTFRDIAALLRARSKDPSLIFQPYADGLLDRHPMI